MGFWFVFFKTHCMHKAYFYCNAGLRLFCPVAVLLMLYVKTGKFSCCSLVKIVLA